MSCILKQLGIIVTILVVLAANADAKPKKDLGSQFGGSLMYQSASNLNRDADRDLSGLYYGSLKYTFKMNSGAWVSSLGVGYQQSYTAYGTPTQTSFAANIPQDQSGDYIDPRLSIIRTFTNTSIDTIAIGAKGAIYGVSKYSQLEGRRASVGPHVSIAESLKSWSMSWLSVSQSFDYRYFMFSDEIQDSGYVNRPHLFTSISGLAFDLGQGFSISNELSYLWTQSFQGVARTLIGVGIEGAYTIDNFSANVGISNGTNGLSVDGLKYEMNVLDADAASIYFSLSLAI